MKTYLLHRIRAASLALAAPAVLLGCQRAPTVKRADLPAYGSRVAFHSATVGDGRGTLYGVTTFADGSRDFLLMVRAGSVLVVPEAECKPAL